MGLSFGAICDKEDDEIFELQERKMPLRMQWIPSTTQN